MENSYTRTLFTFVGNTQYIIESSTNTNFSPLQAMPCLLPVCNVPPSQTIDVEVLFSLSLDDEYWGSTSPYDDDGC